MSTPEFSVEISQNGAGFWITKFIIMIGNSKLTLDPDIKVNLKNKYDYNKGSITLCDAPDNSYISWDENVIKIACSYVGVGVGTSMSSLFEIPTNSKINQKLCESLVKWYESEQIIDKKND